jgi:hypothetical protein
VLQTTHPKTSILGGSPKLRNSLPKGQVVLECEIPAGFFSFLGGTKKKEKNSASALHKVMASEQGVTLHL